MSFYKTQRFPDTPKQQFLTNNKTDKMQQTTYTRIEISPEDLGRIVRTQVAIALREYDNLKSAQEKQVKRDRISVGESAQIAGKSRQTIRNRANEGLLTKYPTRGNLYDLSRKEVEDMYCKIDESV